MSRLIFNHGAEPSAPATGKSALWVSADRQVKVKHDDGSVVTLGAAGISDWQNSVLDKDLSSPPASPAVGDRYIVKSPGAGGWAGRDNNIAEWDGAAWQFIVPNEGFTCEVEDENRIYTYNLPLGGWILLGSIIDHGTLQGLALDHHTQYSLVDGTRAFTGPVSGVDPVDAANFTTKSYVDTLVGNYLPLAGGTMTGNIGMPEDGTIGLTNALLQFDGSGRRLYTTNNIVGFINNGYTTSGTPTGGVDVLFDFTPALTGSSSGAAAGKFHARWAGTPGTWTVDVNGVSGIAQAETNCQGIFGVFGEAKPNVSDLSVGNIMGISGEAVVPYSNTTSSLVVGARARARVADGLLGLSISSAYGAYADVFVGSAGISEATGVYSGIIGTGNPTNTYAFRGAVSAGVNRWGVYIISETWNYLSGKLGIGVTQPTEKLEVAGTTQTTGFKMPTGAVAGYVLTTDATGVGTWQAATGLPSGTSGQTLRHDGTNWAANSLLYNNGTNVCINTTSPFSAATKLTIRASVDESTPFALQNATGGAGLVYEIDGSNNSRVVMHQGAGPATVKIYTAGASYFNGGNVGIGTTAPGSALDVKGTLRLSGSTSGYVGLAPAADAGSTTYTLPTADGTSGQVLSTNGAGVLSWITAAGLPSGTSGQTLRHDGTAWIANSLLFNNGTYVGIGVTAPTSTLEVANTLRVRYPAGGFVEFRADAGGNLELKPAAGGLIQYTYAQNARTEMYDSTATIKNVIHTAGASYFTGGNVGIGTASPEGKLAVAEGGDAIALKVTKNSAQYTLAEFWNGSAWLRITVPQAGIGEVELQGFAFDYLPLRLLFSDIRLFSGGWGANAERMRVASDGKVGIWTSTPTAALDIASNVLRLRTAKTPASASDTGNTGDHCWDANYAYYCVATNTWKRVALSTW